MDCALFFIRRIRVALRHPGWHGVGVLAPCVFVLTSFAASEPSLITGEKKSFGYSWQQELQLGAESDKEITESMGVYPDRQVSAYVEAVGQRVLQQSNFNSPTAPEIYRNTKFTFRVLDSPVVNAFALPGGYVYVTRGLLTHVQNEAQLAVVLGHEIGHVAARHSSQQARRSQWTQLGVLAGSILGQKVLGEKMPDLAPTLLNMGGQAAQMFLLRYSREAENEADTLGVNYAMRNGYAAEQSARFFESLKRISAAEGKALPTWQSTHPDPGDRAQHVTRIASSIPADTRSNVGEEEYLKHIEGMVVGEDPREGFARNGFFYHPGLRFQLPVASGWKLDNQRAAVVFAEPNGRAMMGLRLAPGVRARDAVARFAQESKVQVVASGDTLVNGLPTSVIIGQGNTENGVVGVWNAFIEMDGKVYSILGIAPQPAFEQVRPTFESVAAGFSPLRDPALSNVQPARLKLVRADRNAPFASFVPTALPPDLNAGELAIMNQVALDDNVNQGRILKIPDVPASLPVTASSQPPAAYPPVNAPAGTPPAYPPQPVPQPTYPPQSPASAPPVYAPPAGPTYPQPGYPAPTSNPPAYPAPAPNPQPYPPVTSTPPPVTPGAPQYPVNSPSNVPPPSQVPAQTYPQFPQPPSSTSTNRTSNPPPAVPPTWPR